MQLGSTCSPTAYSERMSFALSAKLACYVKPAEIALKLDSDTVTIIILAFCGSVARGIISPDRRGVLGFVSAALVGLLVGSSAGLISSEFEISTAWQYVIASVFAIAGDRFVFAVLAAATQFSEDPLGTARKWKDAFRGKDSE